MAARCVETHDARKEQRGDLPRTRSVGADGLEPHCCNSQGVEEIRARVGVTGLQARSLLHCMSPLLAHLRRPAMSARRRLLGVKVPAAWLLTRMPIRPQGEVFDGTFFDEFRISG